PACNVTTSAASCSTAVTKMDPGKTLHAGESIKSPNGSYRLIMQGDGNLVLYAPGGNPLWHPGTNGNPDAWAVMQTDGNFVVYSAADSPLWHSHTYGNPGAYLTLGDDSRMRILTADGKELWNVGGSGVVVVSAIDPAAAGVPGRGWGYDLGSYPTVSLGG